MDPNVTAASAIGRVQFRPRQTTYPDPMTTSEATPAPKKPRDTLAMLGALSRMRTGGPYALKAFGARYHSMVAQATHSQSAAPVIAEAARDLPEGARVVEIGAGTGLTSVTLARQRPDLHVTATDLNEAMLLAGQQAQDVPPNVDWTVADACALPFEDGLFDLAVSFNAFKHFPDKHRGVAEMLRVVKPGAPSWCARWRRGSPGPPPGRSCAT